ncbi:MAG: hypothetical protein M1814_004360 [Vezdaea aestivalis]|nr:MAG: hypothetical protein M1814_004360 [Vezdaea aestivalis]
MTVVRQFFSHLRRKQQARFAIPPRRGPVLHRQLSAAARLQNDSEAPPVSQEQAKSQTSKVLGNFFKVMQPTSVNKWSAFPDTLLPKAPQLHHLHVFCHKHNTHISFTRPNRETILTLSVGNLGIRKSRRSEFDSAYQLMSYFLSRIEEQGILVGVEGVELIFRGFGKGRDAAEKALKSSEGRTIRPKIMRVTDATRIKMGGNRGRKPRRL